MTEQDSIDNRIHKSNYVTICNILCCYNNGTLINDTSNGGDSLSGQPFTRPENAFYSSSIRFLS